MQIGKSRRKVNEDKIFLNDTETLKAKLDLWEKSYKHIPVYEFLGMDIIDVYKLHKKRRRFTR